MEAKEWRTLDKSDWPEGPWLSEPDKMQWEDEKTGLPCLIVRNTMGNLCGYVGVGPSHPYYGKECSSDDVTVRVHGGLTFSDSCHSPTPEKWERMKAMEAHHIETAKKYPVGDSAVWLKMWKETLGDYETYKAQAEARVICHVGDEHDPRWWLGFDCGHWGDLIPRMSKFEGHDESYKTIAYVKRECAALAKQLAELA